MPISFEDSQRSNVNQDTANITGASHSNVTGTVHHRSSADGVTGGSSKFFIVLAGILTIAFIEYFALAANWPKFSRAEVFFAECTREMLQHNNIITPLYHGTPFFDKPIFCYWFIALSYKIFGVSHLAARIPSILAATITVALTGLSGRYLFGQKAGLLAAMILASSFMFMSFAAYCMSDMTLILFDTVSLSLLYLATINESKRNILFWLASLSMGLAFLSKGPVGVVLPALNFIVYLSITRQWRIISITRHVITGSFIIGIIASPWFLAAYKENGAGALSYFFIRENLQRFAGSTYDTHKPFWFMLVSLFTGFLPWSIFLPLSLKKSFQEWKDSGRSQVVCQEIYLWLWVATVIGFFSLSRGKIDYYALPAYPACALLVGRYLIEAIKLQERIVKYLGWIFSGIFFASSILVPWIFASMTDHFLVWLPIAGLLLLASLISFQMMRLNKLEEVYKLVFITISFIGILVAVNIYPWLKEKQPILAYTNTIKSAPANTCIGVSSVVQNWVDEITFQTNKEPIVLKNPLVTSQLIKMNTPLLLILTENEFKTLPEDRQNKLVILDSRAFIKNSLNPGFLLVNNSKMCYPEKLLLVRTLFVSPPSPSSFGSSGRPDVSLREGSSPPPALHC